MELIYASKKVKEVCTDPKAAKKLFGGDSKLAIQLRSRIDALERAPTLKDVVAQPQFHFRSLLNKGGKHYEGRYTINVKSIRSFGSSCYFANHQVVLWGERSTIQNP